MKEKKSILHIVQSSGGVSKYLSMLLENIDRNSFTQIVVCSQDYNLDEYKGFADEINVVEMHRKISFKDVIAAYNIRKLIKKYTPDIIYCHSSKGGALGRIACLGLKINVKKIYNPHGWSFNMRCSMFKKSLFVFIERLLSKVTDSFVAISKAENESAISNKIYNGKNTHIIYNGIDIEKAQKTEPIDRKELNIPADAFVIGMAGRLTKQKSPDIFVKAASLIKKEIPEAFFLIIGDGELRPQVERLIREKKLSDSFLITGWVRDAIPYIKIVDVATLLSRWEGFGLAIAEYMAAQKPIIATSVDAIPELITNEKNGLLIDADDIEAFGHAVLRIKNDELLRKKMTEEGLKIVKEKYNIKRVVEEHEKLFNSILENE